MYKKMIRYIKLFNGEDDGQVTKKNKKMYLLGITGLVLVLILYVSITSCYRSVPFKLIDTQIDDQSLYTYRIPKQVKTISYYYDKYEDGIKSDSQLISSSQEFNKVGKISFATELTTEKQVNLLFSADLYAYISIGVRVMTYKEDSVISYRGFKDISPDRDKWYLYAISKNGNEQDFRLFCETGDITNAPKQGELVVVYALLST